MKYPTVVIAGALPYWGPPQSPCKFARPSPVKMLNSLRYLAFRLRRCAVVMESSNICSLNERLQCFEAKVTHRFARRLRRTHDTRVCFKVRARRAFRWDGCPRRGWSTEPEVFRLPILRNGHP